MPEPDFAVVGAGLVGAAIAWGLGRAGASVTVFDAAEDRFHASAGNFGLVWVQGKGAQLSDYARLTRRSADAWSGFADDLTEAAAYDTTSRSRTTTGTGGSGSPLEHTQCGGIKIALSDQELERFCEALARHHNNPDYISNDTRLIDQHELRELLPGIGPEAVGGTWCPHDGHANSLLTLQAFHDALGRQPNVKLLRESVQRIQTRRTDAGFVIHTRNSRLPAARVVLAAGLANCQLAATVGLQAPVRPERGQILVTERCPALLSIACHNIRQTGDGTVLLGDSHEDVGFNTDVTPLTTRTILNRAVRTFPQLAHTRLQRSWAALRVLSPDGYPIYQSSTTHPGASLISCHSGVTLAAAHASEVANALLNDSLNERYPAFSAERFECAA